jgi:hypothetical protein
MSKFIDNIEDDNMPRALNVHVTKPLPPRRQPEVIYQDNPNAIQRHDDGTMTYKRFTMTPVGMFIPEGVEELEWEDVGNVLKDLDSVVSWNLGDWADYANKVWGKEYKVIAAEFGYEPDTLKVYASIARSMPTLIRNQRLSFAHHRVVSKLDDRDLQSAWLNYAAFHGLRVADMKRDMAFLVEHKSSLATDWLYHAIQEKKRLGEYEELNPKQDALPESSSLPNLASEITLIRNNAEYISNGYLHFDELSRESQRSFLDHLDWLEQSVQKVRNVITPRVK